MLTLFGTMTLNDWQLYMLMYHWAGANSATTYIYFVSFIILTQYVLLNILIAFIIDTYSQKQE